MTTSPPLQYGAWKCREDIEIEEKKRRGRNAFKKKNDGILLLWGIFNKCIKENIIMAVLRKTSIHSVNICRLMKNQ